MCSGCPFGVGHGARWFCCSRAAAFCALYFWQIPHFMALAYLCRSDYATGGYKMLSLFDLSGRRTALAAFRNCLYLLPLGFIAFQLGTATKYFTVEATLLTGGMGLMATLFYLKPSTQSARRLFFSSLLYLPLYMSSMVIHRLPNRISSEMDNTKLADEQPAGTLTRWQPEARTVEKKNDALRKILHRPPIAFVSVAPFPLLPFPDDPYRS
eukprot:TRINITY_DN7156_c0_g1_i1.p1 TRINITY_DN7156_c0_g1~~TRINITY_DN7156_c0_g1_i1.p1  ORF type:complete len:211 (-),score=24.35 TRINITY_DN7156_c0_g1_i1:445-1077(-)